MTARRSPPGHGRLIANRVLERLRRSISEFLAIPVLIVAGFFGLALVLYVMDHDAGTEAHWGPLRTFLGRYVGDGETSVGLLTTIAGSLITVTSITFSILLLAVQQGASALTSQIIDHYLRRPSNRVYFGFFVGTSVFALVTLVLTNGASKPVLGVTFATGFAILALFALILLIYSTIDQIRPVSIVNTIHDAAIRVRQSQFEWIARTAEPERPADAGSIVESDRNGYLARIRVDELAQLVERHPGATVTVLPSIGDAVSCGQPLALVTGTPIDSALSSLVRHALSLEEQRDVDRDAAFSVDHLVNIAWTSMSTAKSNPAVALAAGHALADILLRWSGDPDDGARDAAARVRYADRVPDQLVDGLESLVVVASESMQHQSLALVLDAVAAALSRSGPRTTARLEALVLTSIPALGDHLPTRQLEAATDAVCAALRRRGRSDGADKLRAAWSILAATRGTIKSRGDRDQRASR